MRRRAERLHRAAAGFTLIEAIVALVILSTALMEFYSLLSTQLRGAAKLQAASIAYDHRMNALELADSLNPMLMPQGTLDLDSYRIHWNSRLLGDVHQSSGYPVGQGLFQVALYRVTCTFPDDAQTDPIEVTKLGYRRDSLPQSFTPAGPK
ncbi:MAG: prepilin-type N-terminal cleavage/methylation domain-containing protein [Nevskia sp.]|nr:prepilin-type N-terminal cleavage/methylation domain-containing protein [Nevskia sp.]